MRKSEQTLDFLNDFSTDLMRAKPGSLRESIDRSNVDKLSIPTRISLSQLHNSNATVTELCGFEEMCGDHFLLQSIRLQRRAKSALLSSRELSQVND
jgi:hypothetical protein